MDSHQSSKEQASSRTNTDEKEYVKPYIPGHQNKHLVKSKYITDVIEQIRRRKWTWAGHVSRIREKTMDIAYHHLATLQRETI